MWILILVILTSDGDLVPYEQGVYDSWSECYNMKELVLSELNGNYRATCLEW